MKKVLSSLSLLTLSATAMAVNPVPGWYAGGFVGASYIPTADYYTTFAVEPQYGAPSNWSNAQTFQAKYKVFMDFGLSLGYRFEKFRIEGEGLYNTNDLKSISGGGYTVSAMSSSPYLRVAGETNIFGLMVNGLYDLYTPDPDSKVAPYIGLGLGYASVSSEATFYYNNAYIPGVGYKSSNSAVGGQVILGANYFLDDFWAFGMDYRYFSTNKIKDLDSRAQFHSFNLSLTTAFDSVIG